MTDKLVYAVEYRTNDYHDWSVDSLHETQEGAEDTMAEQSLLNRGIDYRINPWVVNSNLGGGK